MMIVIRYGIVLFVVIYYYSIVSEILCHTQSQYKYKARKDFVSVRDAASFRGLGHNKKNHIRYLTLVSFLSLSSTNTSWKHFIKSYTLASVGKQFAGK